MKSNKSSKLRGVLCFGMIVVISLLLPIMTEAHTIGGVEGMVYDGDNPWDDTHVGWFNCDKEVSSSATGKWYTKTYAITTYPLSDFTIPAGAKLLRDSDFTKQSYSCTSSGMIDTAHLFNRWEIVNWAVKSGATFAPDGTLTIYLQPVIGTQTKVTDKTGSYWKDDGVSLTSLAAWKKAKSWANTETFASHYNKPLHIKQATNTITASYVAQSNGEGYGAGQKLQDDVTFNFNIGSQHTYYDTGIVKSITTNVGGEERHFVLSGITVEIPVGDTAGSYGVFKTSQDEENLVSPANEYYTVTGALGTEIPPTGWRFGRKVCLSREKRLTKENICNIILFVETSQ